MSTCPGFVVPGFDGPVFVGSPTSAGCYLLSCPHSLHLSLGIIQIKFKSW